MDYKIAIEKINKIVSESEGSQVLQMVVDFLYDSFDKYSWIGIYILRGDYLVLGPWRGKQATEHTKIPIGKGICGSAAESGKTEIVPNVSKDERYLSCFISTRSEIVVPIKRNKKVIGEIDIDSDLNDAFDEEDKVFLEKIADILARYIC